MKTKLEILLLGIVILFTQTLFANTVSNLKGNMNISQGSMSYSVPLSLPTGTAGVKPSVSLAYSSNGSNAYVGIGWNISAGQSAVSRCGHNLAMDGKVQGVNDNTSDNICLDGQRLVLISGNKWGYDSEYRTKIDSQSKIVYKNNRFYVYSKNGDIKEYHKFNDTWLVKYIKDRYNNKISYNYSYNSNEIYLSSITYFNNKVQFNYETKKDQFSGYSNGKAIKITKRIKSIDIRSGSKTLRTYKLGYRYQASNFDKSVLESIIECSNGQCLKPLTFSASNSQNSTFNSGKHWQSDLGDDWKNRPSHKSGEHSQLIDMNGDSFPDRVFDRNPNNNKQGFYVMLNKGNGIFDSGKHWQTDLGHDWTNRPSHKGGEHSMLIDMNGDGLPDRVFDRNPRNYKQGFYVMLNTGNGFDSGKHWQTDLGHDWTNRPSHKGGEHSMLIDMNGDGLPDRVFDRNPHNSRQGLYVMLNIGNGFDSGKHWQTDLGDDWKNRPSHKGGEHSTLMDINGDGLPDRVFDRNPHNNKQGLYVKLNTGSGFEYGRHWQSDLGDDWKNRPSHKSGQHSMFIDMNGDGLPDRVFDRNPSNNGQGFYVMLNSGNGFGKGKYWQLDLGDDWKNRPIHGSGEHSTLMDINGDGFPDRIWDRNPLNNKQGLYVTLNNGYNLGKITKITDSFGNQTTINYKRLNDKSSSIYKKYANSKYPDRDIISGMQVVESVISKGSNNTTLKTSYKYEGFKTNLRGLGSYGFAKVTTINHLNNSRTVENYRQDYPYIGMLKDSYSYLGSELLSKSYMDYSYSKYGNNIYQIRNHKQRSYSYEDGSLIKSETTTSSNYDEYGNIGVIETKIVDETNGDEFTKTTTNSYENDEYRWILARLTESTVESSAYGDSKTKTSSFTYDDYKGTLLSETIEPYSDKWFKKSYAYDAKGNKIRETIVGANIKARTTITQYDKEGKFAIKVTNPLGHSETKTFNEDGQILTLRGPNGLKTTWQYDNFGKKIKELRADGTATVYSYNWNNSFGALYKITISNSSAKPISTYYNKLGQSIRSQKVAFDGRTIYSATYYNKFGKIEKKSTPYFSGTNPEYSYIYYDKYQRPISQNDPAPNDQRAIQFIRYDGFTTTTINSKDHERKVTKNVLGKITYIEEEEGSNTNYEYDANGQLVRTVDGAGNIIELRYDIFGNKIYQDDPDMGKWSYSYNSLGQLTSQKDAKNQTSYMYYDILGRKIKEVNGDGISTWTYDTNYKGQLYKEEKPGYRKIYKYDRYGRVTNTRTTIDGINYNQSYKYDQYGRLIEKTLPNNFKVKNTYNSNGYLESIKSPVDQIKDFDPNHFVNLIDETLTSSIDYYKKQREYEHKAYSLERRARYYRYIANYNTNYREILLSYAKRFESYAIKYRVKAERNKYWADYYKNKSDYFLRKASRYSKSRWGRNYSSYYSRLSNRYRYYADRYLYWSKYYIEKAAYEQKRSDWYKNYASTRDYNYYKKRGKYYSNLANKTINEYKTALNIAQNYEEKAKDNHIVNQHYQQILSDKNHNYFYKVVEQDSFGRVVKYLSGNGLITNKEYSGAGYLEKISTGYSFEDDNIRSLTFEYDKLSNVITRNDHKLEVYQNYTYDRLNRITNAYTDTKNSSTVMSYNYDIVGNMTYKSDIGSYTYSSSNPHQVIRAGSKSFSYDANGNMVNNDGTKISYTSYNKANKIITKNDTIKFAYDTSKFRYKKSTTKYNTHYLDKSYEATTYKNGNSELKYFIYAGGKVVSIYTDTTKTNTASSTKYLHYDSLNSVDTITNNLGVVESRSAYKPFGEKLKLDKHGNPTNKPSFTNRGYTGHEHIEETHLIHMNARLYDPTIGRFTSADSMIPYMYETQSFNRYSYVQNNPLKYTDPSGHWGIRKAFKSYTNAYKRAASWAKQNWKTIATVAVVIAVGAMTGGAGLALAGSMGLSGTAATIVAGAVSGAIAGAVGGVVGTRLHGGSWDDAFKAGVKGAVVGAVSGGFAAGVAEGTAAYFNIGSEAAHGASFLSGGNTAVAAFKAVAHGISRAAIARARGQDERSAFISGFVSSGFAAPKSMGVFGGTAVTAIVSGTVSQATGGKFANGAMTGAFIHMYNSAFTKLFEPVSMGRCSDLRAQGCGHENVLTADAKMSSSADSQGGAEHTKNARPSTLGKHQKGQARKNQKFTDKKRNPKKGWYSRK